MAQVGYARVSSVGQSLAVQLDKLQHCDKVFQETISGAAGTRPRLEACLEYVREGDTLVVTRLDRLARSTLHLCQIAAELARKQVHLQVLDQHLDTGDATGRLLFHMLGRHCAVRDRAAGRAADGWDPEGQSAWGALGSEKAVDAHSNAQSSGINAPQGVLISTLMREYHLSKASVYRYLRDLDAVPSP